MLRFEKIKKFINAFSLRQLLLLAFALRIIWYLFILFTNPDGFWLYDSYGYWNIANNVKEYGIFSRDEIEPLLPDYFRTPLYPLLILPTIYFDINGYSIPLIHILLDCITCYLVYKIVFDFSKKETYAKIALFIYAIHIPAIVFSNYVLTESIFAFLLTLFVYSLTKLIQVTNYKKALLTGLIGGVCVMCKPIAFVLLLPTIVLLLIVKKINFQTVITVLCLSTAFYAIQIPWLQRNKNLFGKYFNSVLGEHLLLGYHASNIYAKANSIHFNEAQEILRYKFFDKLEFNPYKYPYEYAKIIEKESYKILLANKWLFVKEHTKECIKFFVQPMRGYILSQLGKNHSYSKWLTYSMVLVQLLCTAVLFLIIAYAIYLRFKKQLRFSYLIVFIGVLLFIFSQFNTMPFTDARMRFPLDALIIIASILCLYQIRGKAIAKSI
jgi:4-amino-4-deoxy-L-arabinose transferase-like glycosyltransferase